MKITLSSVPSFACVHQPDGFKDHFSCDFCCLRHFVLLGLLRRCRGQALGVEVRFNLLRKFQTELILRVGVGVHPGGGSRVTCVALHRLEVAV